MTTIDDPPDTQPAPVASLGLRALAIAQQALAAGVREHPAGSNRGPEIDGYLRGCIRHGKPLGVLGVAWCAAFASWCVWAAWGVKHDTDPAARQTRFEALGDVELWDIVPASRGGYPPIGYRAAVSELVTDARATNKWWAVEGGYTPKAGDLAIWRRAGQDPRTGGSGHVEFVEIAPDGYGAWTGVGGNEGDAVRRETHSIHDHDLVGWICLS